MELHGLNPPQREAVEHGVGPLLILAGAGSGKTRVITHRLARLVERGVHPWRILAVTFTNKAAGEMRNRAAQLVGDEQARKMWIGTFHATCAKLLRLHAAEAGLPPDFLIYDDDDQKKLVTRVMKDLGTSERFTPRFMLSRIDQAKNEGIAADDYAPDSYEEEIVAPVYVEFQKRLRAAGAVDFGDLLVETLRLLDHRDAGPRLARRFEHVLVDEFQDTNRVQYRIVQKLAASENLCVVGDDDQSIYRWRGADVRNILDFERDYPGCAVVKLEQNYRSTEVVLEAANGIIRRNVQRKQKRLFTEHKGGEPIIYFTAWDERREADFIVRAVKQLIAAEGRSVRDFAVLYRVHAQSRALEEALRSVNLPYSIFGGVRFFDRTEVKDLLAYLRVLANSADEVSLERIVNVPPRGIGDTTLERLAHHAATHKITLSESVKRAAEIEEIAARTKESLAQFTHMMERHRPALEEGFNLAQVARSLLDEAGLKDDLIHAGPTALAAQRRIENVDGFLRALDNWEKRQRTAGTTARAALADYLHRLSLVSSDEDEGDDSDATKVTMVTLHGAKGLEFKVVFLVGLEEELLPHRRTLNPTATDIVEGDPNAVDISEERRLMYVGITRARELLYLSRCRERGFRGETGRAAGPGKPRTPSRFLDEIPPELLEERDVQAKAATSPEDEEAFARETLAKLRAMMAE